MPITSLTGGQWGVVLALSLVTPVAVWVDKTIQLRRQSQAHASVGGQLRVRPAAQASG